MIPPWAYELLWGPPTPPYAGGAGPVDGPDEDSSCLSQNVLCQRNGLDHVVALGVRWRINSTLHQ